MYQGMEGKTGDRSTFGRTQSSEADSPEWRLRTVYRRGAQAESGSALNQSRDENGQIDGTEQPDRLNSARPTLGNGRQS